MYKSIIRLLCGCAIVVAVMTAIPTVLTQDAASTVTPTTELADAEAGEYLVIVAAIDQQGEQTVESKTMLEQFEASIQAVMDDPLLKDFPIRIEQNDIVVAGRDEAQTLANDHNATMVIWGSVTNSKLTVHYRTTPRWGQTKAILEDTQFVPASEAINDMISRFDGRIDRDYFTNFTLALVLSSADAYASALPLYEAALETIEDQPKAVQLRYQADLAWTFVGYIRAVFQSDMVGAEAAYTQAIVLNINYTSAYLGRGRTLFEQGKLDAAVGDYSRAIVLDSQNVEAYVNRGLALYSQGRFDEAIADFTKAIDVNPKSWYPFADRAIAFFQQGKYDNAIDDLTQALQINPEYAAGYYNRGTAYYAQKKVNEALADYLQTIAIDAQYANAYWGLGNIYYVQARYAESLENYQHYLDLAGDQNAELVVEKVKELEALLGITT